jgi:hypothetical protein
MAQSLRIAAIAVLALTGCGEAPVPDDVTRETLGDTTFVSSPAEGVDGPAQAIELLRIPAEQLDVGVFFSGAFGPAGTIWIYDSQGPGGEALLVFDSLGQRLATAGRSGAGPGEYQGGARLFCMGDGTMLLRVMNTTRVLRFDARGEVLSTVELPPVAMHGWLVTPDPHGGWYQAAAFEQSVATRVGRYGWIHFDRDGTVVDTVFPPARFFEEPTPLGVAPGRVRTVTREGEMITALPGPSRIDRIERDGRVTAMTWRGEAPPYGEQERRDLQPVSDRMHEALQLPPVPLPERKASVHLLLTDPEGGVWAAMGAEGVRIPDEELPTNPGWLPPVKWVDRDRWGYFDRDGVLRFVVQLPEGTALLDRAGRRLLGVATERDGTQSLVVWGIAAGGDTPHN